MSKHNKLTVIGNCLLAAMLTSLLWVPASVAQDDKSASTSSGNTNTSGAPAATNDVANSSDSSMNANTSLKGNIQKVELGLQDLRDVGLDLKQVLKSVSGLYDEVTIQPVRIITEPEVIGLGTVIYIPIGTEPTGPVQPARKERVDLAMTAIKPMIRLMKRNVDAFVSGQQQIDLPANVLTELKPQFQQWVALINNVAAEETALDQLTQGPPYNNTQIASLCTTIEKNIQLLDRTRMQIYKVIRKEGKRIANRN